MKRLVWKYDLDLTAMATPTSLRLPLGSEVLAAQMQDAGAQVPGIKLWALVDPSAQEFEQRSFMIVGTNIPDVIDDRMQYISTCQIADTVWHVFEVTEGTE